MSKQKTKNAGWLRGIIHVHTTLSHDGTLTLNELAKFFKDRGYDFLAVTEHSYDINQESIDMLVADCRQISTSEFLVIPGIEFRCHDNIDILGYGVTHTCNSDDPATIIKHIQTCGGVAVFAHPTMGNYPIEKDWIQLLDGAELWNRQEGKYLPQVVSMKRFIQFQKWNPDILAFCGLDFHRKKSYYEVAAIVMAESNDKDVILKTLRQGDFYTQTPYFNVGSDGQIGFLKRYFIYVLSSILNLIRNTRESFS